MPEPTSLALVAAILLGASLVQGFFGFGFGILAMVGLTLSHDLVHASGVVNLTGLLLTSSIVFQLRRHVLWHLLRRMAPAVFVGVAIGVTALRVVDRETMVRILGATVVVIAAWNLAAPALRQRETPVRDVAVALLGGVLGGAFNTGGPPLVAHLYRRADSPETLKATIQAVFISIGLSRLPLATAHGLMAGGVWRDAALGLPFVLAGSLGGIALARRLPAERFRRAVWIAFAALGVGLLLSG